MAIPNDRQAGAKWKAPSTGPATFHIRCATLDSQKKQFIFQFSEKILKLNILTANSGKHTKICPLLNWKIL